MTSVQGKKNHQLIFSGCVYVDGTRTRTRPGINITSTRIIDKFFFGARIYF